jgi:hypothetical protein
MPTQKKKRFSKAPIVPKMHIVRKMIDSWQHIHTILIIVVMVVGMTVGVLTFFVSAEDFNKFQKDVNVYQLEDQATKANDRIIDLNKEINSDMLSTAEKVNRIVEKQKLEKRVESINKKLDPLYGVQPKEK